MSRVVPYLLGGLISLSLVVASVAVGQALHQDSIRVTEPLECKELR